MAPVLPPVPSPIRSQPSNAASLISSRVLTAANHCTFVDTPSSRGSSQQQVIQQQQQLQQHPQQQQLLSAQSSILAPLQTGMAAPYASASGLIKSPAEMPAAATSLLSIRPHQVAVAAGMCGPSSSRQCSMNSNFFDADSVFETGCNSRESFLLPEDLEDAPFSSAAAGVMMSSTPPISAVAADNGAAGANTGKWLSGIATPTAARSPLVSASTVAALMDDDNTPNMDLLQLDGHLGVPGSSPFGCQLMDDDPSEHLLSFCDPEAVPTAAADVTALFDTPQATNGSSAAADTAAAGMLSSQPRRGMVSLTASMAAAAVLRRGQQHDSSSTGTVASSGQPSDAHGVQQQQQQMYTLVLLDGSTGAPMTAAAGARDAEQLSYMMGNSPTKSASLHGPLRGEYAFGGNSATVQAAAAGAPAAALDHAFHAAVAGVAPTRGAGSGSGRGRGGRPKGSVGRPSAAAKAAKAAAAAAAAAASAAATGVHGNMDGPGVPAMDDAAVAAANLEMIPASNNSSRRGSDAGETLGFADPAAAAASVAVTRADSGSGGDSSNESATQQQDDVSKAPAVVVPAAAAGGASKHAQRHFHHKGGGPCDHCGVLESPQWRRGPPAKPILCNACGTRYRRTHNLGPPIPSSGRPGGRQGTGSTSSISRDSHTHVAAVSRPHGSSSSSSSSVGGGGGGGGRKRPAAAAALQTPVVVNMHGGVHTGTRSGGCPAASRRPVLKMARS